MTGDFENAIKFYQKAQQESIAVNYKFGILWMSIALIDLYLQMGRYNEAETINQQLQTNKGYQKEWRYNVYCRYCKAVMQKIQFSMRTWGSAEDIFQSIISEDGEKGDLNETRLKIPIIRHLIEIRMEELKLWNQDETMNDIRQLIKNFRSVAHRQGIFYLVLESLILEAKLISIDGKFDEASQLLEQAIQLASIKGLTSQLDYAREEQEVLKGSFKKLQEFVEKNPSWVDRIKYQEITEYINKAKFQFY